MAAVARATGAELRGQAADAGAVTIALDAVPLNDALHRLLGTQSFTVTYGTGDRVKTIAQREIPVNGRLAQAALVDQDPRLRARCGLRSARSSRTPSCATRSRPP